ncbi:uncharacterized protein LOC133192503 [Saccostrea echinata]|uniref:uncharacterized protein LOC133192503 n=1 Tax=Saccostrea echinata TaxID=191078 RepID=UPI002A815991|nr:uncharacterized protein LOC133192503 [Saccostrea echinata]
MSFKMEEGNETVNLTTTQFIQSDVSVRLELYSWIFSVVVLCLSILLGTSGNILVITAMCRNRLYRKVRYALLLLLMAVALFTDLVYCPVELVRIFLYSNSDNSWVDLKYVSSSMYLIVFSAISCVLLFISLKNLCIITEKFTRTYRYALCAFCVITTLLVILCPAIGYGILSNMDEEKNGSFTPYHILNERAFLFRITYFSLWLMIILFVLVGMISFMVVTYRAKQSDLDLSSDFSHPHTPDKAIIPKVLVKKSENSLHSDEEEEEEETGNRLLDSCSGKEDNTSTIGDLPSPSRSKGSHLGVNMAAYLGRRRHTIGQIGTTGLETMEKAKQYNYVRKFSVDIQALQAQLENPKRHASDFPFSSDTEIQKSLQKSNNKEDILKRIRLAQQSPLVQNNKTSDCEKETNSDSSSRNSEKTSNEVLHELPPLLTLSETMADEFRERAQEKDPSASFIKLSCSLVLTFLCFMLPMFITETLKELISLTAYINVLSSTLALSTVQTLIFPLIILFLDKYVHKCFQKMVSTLRMKCFGLCYQREAVPMSSHEEEDISNTQV